MAAVQLLTAVTADTVGQWIKTGNCQQPNCQVSGPIGGGTLYFQTCNENLPMYPSTIRNIDGTRYEVTEASFYSGETAYIVPLTALGDGQMFRAVLTGSTSPNLTVTFNA